MKKMINMSIKAKVDNVGRVIIPFQYRKALGIELQDYVDMEFRENGVFISKKSEKEVLKSKLDDVILAANECKGIDPKEVATLVSILSKLV